MSDETNKQPTQEEILDKWAWSPLAFISDVWHLEPQRTKPEFKARYQLGLALAGKQWDEFCATVRPHWFQEYRDGVEITWQQTLVLFGIEKALRGELATRISVVSGHGIGKSTLLSWLILWFLYTHDLSQSASTSPSKEQMYDVLWKELKKWIDKMPDTMGEQFIWETSHIRMKEKPETWFARAKTASKENTEALAGVHADWVFLNVDEASGVEETIFETMEGALTSGNTIVFLISNGTRPIGYFYDTHHKDKDRWQCYSFSSLDSPRVDQKFVDNIVQKYGSDSTQYAIRVLGQFPDEGVMDDKGYVQLFNEKELHIVAPDLNWTPVGRALAGLDASGEGQDKTEWAVRDRMRAAIIAEEETSTSSSMALKSITIVDKYNIDPIDFTIDAFGKGQDVGMEIALATSKQKRPWRVTPLNVGDPCDIDADNLLYMNIRAMLYYKFMLWCRSGGEIMDSPRLKDQLLSIRFRRTARGRIQIMDKVSMKKLGFPSPDKADAIALTFYRPENLIARRSRWGEEEAPETPFDRYAPAGDF